MVLSNLYHEMLHKHTWCHGVLAHITLLMSDRHRTLLVRARAHEEERHRGRMDVGVKAMKSSFDNRSTIVCLKRLLWNNAHPERLEVPMLKALVGGEGVRREGIKRERERSTRRERRNRSSNNRLAPLFDDGFPCESGGRGKAQQGRQTMNKRRQKGP